MATKRRKRKPKNKHDSKPKEQDTVQRDAEQPASPIEIELEIEDSVSPAEPRDENESPLSPDAISPHRKEDAEEPALDSLQPAGADRRSHPRYAFTAPVVVVAATHGAEIRTRVRDLSQEGCYVDTDNPLALGTATRVVITKGAESFAALARVVFNQPGKGMGLMFTAVELEHVQTLNLWIAESRESSWLATNRRRSQRVLMHIPVRISGQAAGDSSLLEDLEEETHTLAVSAHGALLVVASPMYRGQRFTLLNMQTKASLECVVVHVDRSSGDETKVGVEFMLPNSRFWGVAFPPNDWTPRHPDAKSAKSETQSE